MSRDSNKRWRQQNREKWLKMNHENYKKHSRVLIAYNQARKHMMIDAVAALADREEELAGMAEILFGGISGE
jgi:predicted MarR family transcription regulator